MLSKSLGWISVLLLVVFWVTPFSVDQSYVIHLATDIAAVGFSLYAAFTSGRAWLIPTIAAGITFLLFVTGAAPGVAANF